MGSTAFPPGPLPIFRFQVGASPRWRSLLPLVGPGGAHLQMRRAFPMDVASSYLDYVPDLDDESAEAVLRRRAQAGDCCTRAGPNMRIHIAAAPAVGPRHRCADPASPACIAAAAEELYT